MIRGALAIGSVMVLFISGCLIPGEPERDADFVIRGTADEGTSQNLHSVPAPGGIAGSTICANGDMEHMSLAFVRGPQSADHPLSPSDGELPYCATISVDSDERPWSLVVMTIDGGAYTIRLWWE